MLGERYYTPEEGWTRKDVVNNRDEFTVTGGTLYNPGFHGPHSEHPSQVGFQKISCTAPKGTRSIRMIGQLCTVAGCDVNVFVGGRLIGKWTAINCDVPDPLEEKYRCRFEQVVNITKDTILEIAPSDSRGHGSSIQFHSVDYLIGSPEYYVLHDDGYKSITDTGLQSLPDFAVTAESMQAYGFTDAQMLAGVAEQLPDSFDLLRYHPDSANTSVQITHLPSPQLVTATTDLNLSAYSLIKQITLTTSGSSGAARVVFSFDRGATWHTYADGSWQAIALTVEAVAAGGITPKAFQAIPPEQWTAAVTGPMRVAYYLAKAAATDDLAVAALSVVGDTALWSKARRAVDYNGLLPNTGTMIIQLLTDGSYKINYMSNQ